MYGNHIKISYDNHDEVDFYFFKWNYIIFNMQS